MKLFLLALGLTCARATATPALERSYPNGDVYFLAGRLESRAVREQAVAFLDACPALTRLGFRTIINLTASVCDLREALANPRVRAIVWTSHGEEERGLIDCNGVAVPKTTFVGLGRRGSEFGKVFFFVQACFAKKIVKRYRDKKKMPFISWNYYDASDGGREGVVYCNRLTEYLRQGKLDGDLAEVFSPELRERCALALDPRDQPAVRWRAPRTSLYGRRRVQVRK